MIRNLSTIFLLALTACQLKEENVTLVNWSAVESIDLEKINSDVMPGAPTIDVGIYFPSNLDPQFDKVTLEQVIEGFLSAKDIYKPTGVQLNLLWLKTGVVDERFLSIQANEVPGVPHTEYVNM